MTPAKPDPRAALAEARQLARGTLMPEGVESAIIALCSAVESLLPPEPKPEPPDYEWLAERTQRAWISAWGGPGVWRTVAKDVVEALLHDPQSSNYRTFGGTILLSADTLRKMREWAKKGDT